MPQERPHRLRVQGKKLIGNEGRAEWVPLLSGPVTAPRYRRPSGVEHAQLVDQAKHWLADGVVQRIPPQPFVNNTVHVAKKDGRIRVCLDCTPVNAVTQDYGWPLPRLQDMRHRIKGSRWFTRLDLKDAFFRISIPGPWRRYTAFRVGNEYYQFRKMPFGLKTAPSVFQEFMDFGLAEHSAYAFWYMDDILVHARTLTDLRTVTTRVKQTLARRGQRINEDKSRYEQQELLFVGLWVFSSGLGPNAEKVKEVLALPEPRTKKEVQSALGLVSYLRDFVPLASHFTAQLYPGQGQTLSEGQRSELWAALLRHVAGSITTIRHWDEHGDADLYADASGLGLGVIILQKGRIISMISRKLTAAEARYSTTDREHLALVFAAKRFRPFLHRARGTTRTWSDHAPLIGRREEDMTPRQARWHTIIKQWMPNLIHIKGTINPADWVSRLGIEVLQGGVRA